MNKIILTVLSGAFLICSCCMRAHCSTLDRIIVDDSYINSTSLIRVETSEDDDKSLESIRVKLDHSAYKDITDTKSFSVNKNCTAYVKIRYHYKNGDDDTVELEKKITNFDDIAPKVSAFIKGEDLTIKISDDISGPKLINVEGIDYTQFTDGMISINLKDLENTKEYFTIYALDNALNRTNTLRVYNPYYVGEKTKSNTDKGIDNPQSNDATKPTSATGQIISHTDEDGDDLMNVTYQAFKQGDISGTAKGSKQFFTVKTKSDKVFYIVVDESYDKQTAYLLTEASENDLLNFVNYDGNSIDTGETTVYTIPKQSRDETKDDQETESQPVKEKEKRKTPIGIMLIAAIAGGGIYFYKLKKKKSEEDEDDDANDPDDEFDDEV
ncbi:MAG: DUF4366 domain-containing protein [Lachnospiraceae bacterium]|nr:DUF4366 domain-containing protein [Lachnospiraceae bacterium]